MIFIKHFNELSWHDQPFLTINIIVSVIVFILFFIRWLEDFRDSSTEPIDFIGNTLMLVVSTIGSIFIGWLWLALGILAMPFLLLWLLKKYLDKRRYEKAKR